ncbi:trypco2 family protein [Streptomyces sp. NRRL F-5123]|uniref:trypco2 family protein n=1 Tax=Streptomyces sp. NRRL F-5123 TaxID=1463856 RepID=UPI00069415AF|nr:trypco2 family protein [Streptomyces sp. NRRL F-5123]
MEEPSFVGLAEVITQIRTELQQARGAAEGEQIGFTVEKVSLEFTVQVHRTGRAGGGLRIGVVTAELGGSVDSGTTHRVQVDLEPHDTSTGGRVQVTRPPETAPATPATPGLR